MAKQKKKVASKIKKELEEMEEEIQEHEENKFVKSGKFGYYVVVDNVVNELRKRYTFKTIYTKNSEEIYVYSKGIYVPKGKEIIKIECEHLLGSHAKVKPINEILEKIKRQTAIDQEEFNIVPVNLIALNNVTYNLDTQKPMAFKDTNYFHKKIPVNYNPDATCPVFQKFIEETILPDEVEALQEFIGFCLYREYRFKKAVILVGDKDTGKTVLLDTIYSLLGVDNVSGISLQRITSSDKFAVGSLHNKLANIYDDLSAHDLNDTGGLKIATGGGVMTGEHKFGETFTFRNVAKLMFACNRIPSISVGDDAYFDRWLIFQFLNKVENENQDPELKNKLRKELEGILIWAIEGLNRLLKNGKFTYNKTVDEIRAIMNSHGHPLGMFALQCLEKDENTEIAKEEMHRAYCIWSNENKQPILTKEMIGRNLQRFIPITETHGNIRKWKGYKLSESFSKKVSNVSMKDNSNDTLDTFSKNMSKPLYTKGIDMFSKIVSNLTKDNKLNELDEDLQR